MRILLIAMLCWSGLAWAQTVYESKEPSGVPVFSDQPSPGAVERRVSPPVVQPSGAAPAAAQPAPKPEPDRAYRSLGITSPEDEGSLWSNTGAFEIRVSLEPELRVEQGDAFVVSIDGVPLARMFSSNAIAIRAADWRSTPQEAVELHTVQVDVLDRTGTGLISSSPVRFYLRRHLGAP